MTYHTHLPLKVSLALFYEVTFRYAIVIKPYWLLERKALYGRGKIGANYRYQIVT